MKNTIALWLCVTLMVTTMTEAFPISGSQRCLCRGKMQTRVNPKNVLQLTVYQKSPSCDRVELIVQLDKPRQTVCLDPNSPMGQQIVAKVGTKQK